jgi:hypothetical protein
MSDDIIEFYKQANESKSVDTPVKSELLDEAVPVTDDPFANFLLVLNKNLKNKQIPVKQPVVEELKEEPVVEVSLNTDEASPLDTFIDKLQTIVKTKKEQSVKDAAIGFLNELKEKAVEEPKVEEEVPVIENNIEEEKVEEPELPVVQQAEEEAKPDDELPYVKELKAVSKLPKVPKGTTKPNDIKAIIAQQVDAQSSKILEEVKAYARKILDLGGGGGSVAQQFANGGTMTGDLNVTGQYLSGGVNLSTIFSSTTGGGGGTSDRLVSGSSSLILNPDGSLQFPNNIVRSSDNTEIILESEYATLSAYTQVALTPHGFIAYDSAGDSITFDSISNTIVFKTNNEYTWTLDGQGNIIGPSGMFVVSGNSNTTGNILSAGVNLNEIFATGTSSGDPAVNTWVRSNSADATFTSSVSAPALSGTFYGDGSNLTGINVSQIYQIGSGCNSIQPVNGNNSASGCYSNIAGGACNNTYDCYSFIGGGYSNTSSGYYSVIAGGRNNTISGDYLGQYTGIGGGKDNTVSGYGSYIGGGVGNTVDGAYYNVVAGGGSNHATGAWSGVLGGFLNTASRFATVGGGKNNTASGYYSAITGGSYNLACGNSTFIGSGKCNCITESGSYSTAFNNSSIVGGNNNCIFAADTGGSYCNNIISGGSNNEIAGGAFVDVGDSGIGSGYSNAIVAASYGVISNSYIAAGYKNCIYTINNDNTFAGSTNSHSSTIAGGSCNCIAANNSFIGGGYSNTLSGNNSFIAGGSNNYTQFNNTFILGSSLSATQANTTYVNNIISPIYCGTTGSSYYNPGTCSTYLGGIGGYISVRGGSTYGPANGGCGGCIDVSGSDTIGGSSSSPGANGGCIIMTGGPTGGADSGNYPGKGGCIIAVGGSTTGGSTNTGGNAGCLIFNGGGGSGSGYSGGGGGVLNISGGDATGSRGGYCGGNIITCNGGGSIITTGKGCIGLGSASAYQQTMLCGTISSGYNQTLCFPDTCGYGGTIALTSSTVACAGNGVVQSAINTYNGFIGGGRCNCASTTFTFIGGGCCNTASSCGASVLAGTCNTASGNYSFISSGIRNNIAGPVNYYTVTISGSYNGYDDGVYTSLTNNTSSVFRGPNGYTIAVNGLDWALNGYYGGRDYVAYNAGGEPLVNDTAFFYETAPEFPVAVNGILSYVPYGQLSTITGGSNNTLSGNNSFIAAGSGNNSGFNNTFILGTNITAPSANYTFVNNLSSQGTIAAANITINQSPTTFSNPVTASGAFLVVNINGTNKAIQLWDYSS